MTFRIATIQNYYFYIWPKILNILPCSINLSNKKCLKIIILNIFWGAVIWTVLVWTGIFLLNKIHGISDRFFGP
jgi:hypothetical protein